MGITEIFRERGWNHAKIETYDLRDLPKYDPERILAEALIRAGLSLFPGEEVYRPDKNTKPKPDLRNQKKLCTLTDFRVIMTGPDGVDQIVHIEVGWSTDSSHKRRQREVAEAAGIKYIQIDAQTADALKRVQPQQVRLFLFNLLFAKS